MYSELKGKGLELVAINARDSVEIVTKYVKDNNFTFPIVMGGSGEMYTIGKTYGVRAYPTNYLVDSTGKIVWRGVGFSPATENAIKEALGKLGVK